MKSFTSEYNATALCSGQVAPGSVDVTLCYEIRTGNEIRFICT